MAETFNKKEREKKRRKRRENKAEKKAQRKSEGVKGNEIMYVDEFGNFTSVAPDPSKKIKIKQEDIEISVAPKSELEDEDPIRSGRVKFFNTEKGYGFIIDDRTGDSFFTHANNLLDEVMENDKVQFEIGTGNKGPIAIDVRLA